MKSNMKDLIDTFNKYHRDAMIKETPFGCIYHVKSDSNAIGYAEVFEI